MSYPLQIQLALRSGITIDQLVEKYKLITKRHSKYNNLILFKYAQIESPFSEQVVRESRGLILDESNNFTVVNHSFNKFFNHGEGSAARIDWSTAVCQEKLDGSLMQLFHYNNEWLVASSGSADASGNVGKSEITFAELFWQTFNSMGGKLPTNVNECYSFELTGPLNRVVVMHDTAKLTLLAARDLSSGNEISLDSIADDYLNIPKVKTFPLQSFEEIQETFDKLSPLVTEGYIVVDSSFSRQKLKHPGYVALHHMRDSFSTRAMVDVARLRELDELLTAFPEYSKTLYTISGGLDQLAIQMEWEYEKFKSLGSQKEFALKVCETRFSNYHFQKRARKVKSAKEYLKVSKLDAVVELLGLDTANEL